MATIRFTKKDKFSDIRTALESAGLLTETRAEFIDHEIEMLSRKNSTTTNRKPTKAQKENEELKAQVFEYMTNKAAPVTASEIMNEIKLNSTQKATALLNMLATDGKISRSSEKGKASFSVVE